MNKKIISTMLSLFVITSSISAFAYSDCNSETVATLTKLEVLSGYDDGTFKPDSLISRAEFAKIISVVRGGADLNSSDLPECSFSDVDSNHWALNYILHCTSSELVDGYEDGTFRPNENISIAEAVKVCLTAVQYNNLITNKSEIWYEPWIDLAYEHNVINTKDIDPNRKATRTEIADMVYKTINLPLCKLVGYHLVDGVLTPKFDFADGTIDNNGDEKSLETLLTTYLQ